MLNYFSRAQPKTWRPPWGYFARKLRHVPISINTSNLYVTTIHTGHYQTSEVVDFANSYGERSAHY